MTAMSMYAGNVPPKLAHAGHGMWLGYAERARAHLEL
jgi:hypothetical protein